MEEHRHIVEQTLVPHSAFELGVSRIKQCIELSRGASEPVCIAIVGESRTGKTRVLKSIIRAYPPQRRAEGLNVPVLRLSVPAKPTVKSLSEDVLRALGDPAFDKGTEISKTKRIAQLFAAAGVQALLLEEFQHFQEKTSHKTWEYVTDWLKVLVDATGVALVVGGLPRCLDVIHQNAQLAGRFLAPVIMPRFDWRQANDREEFLGITGAFGTALSRHFDLPALDSEEMGFRLYCATGGLMGYLTKLLRQATWNAIDLQDPRIRLEDLNRAYLQAIACEAQVPTHSRPFGATFQATADEHTLAAVRRIGLPVEEPIDAELGALGENAIPASAANSDPVDNGASGAPAAPSPRRPRGGSPKARRETAAAVLTAHAPQ